MDGQGNKVGRHFAGPTWEHKDGSLVTAKLVARVDSPDAAAIPWLLLSVTGHSGEGTLSQVTTIQRLNTVGGQPPKECSEAELNKEARSHYAAEYFFYSSG